MELTLKIIEIIGTFLGLWLILKQLKLNKKDYDSKFTYQKREKAVELAREFEKFIEDSLLIFNLISKTEIVNYMQKLDLDNGKNCLINFDIHELKKFFNDYESNKDKYNILSNIEKIAPQDIYMFMKDYDEDKYTQQKLEYFYSNSFKMFDLKKEIEDLKDKELKMYRLQYNTDLPFFMGSMFNDIYLLFTDNLNRLEYFSMNFIADIADDNIVYYSLHQVFLSYVEICYFHIAEMNSKGAKDKYYTNMIELYKKWKKRYLEAVEKENKAKETINNVDINHTKI
ncbi:hypothetical protein HMPREF0946_01106 [Fusobacterium vincentii 3_1_36A2]|uniref:Uncharacterized protein n=1 Tax=Fusobacterium vincentii 3_1_36A2 TaxID=469604 RepID=C7XQE0_FUSVC|nr:MULTISPECIES: hypothetical protein [Fusobacterium]EEU33033.1 hypothetical protein HMPREF0946_01106 [Fusobacterium vincentii 3_1_36A2]